MYLDAQDAYRYRYAASDAWTAHDLISACQPVSQKASQPVSQPVSLSASQSAWHGKWSHTARTLLSPQHALRKIRHTDSAQSKTHKTQDAGCRMQDARQRARRKLQVIWYCTQAWQTWQTWQTGRPRQEAPGKRQKAKGKRQAGRRAGRRQADPSRQASSGQEVDWKQANIGKNRRKQVQKSSKRFKKAVKVVKDQKMKYCIKRNQKR